MKIRIKEYSDCYAHILVDKVNEGIENKNILDVQFVKNETSNTWLAFVKEILER